MFQFYIEVGMHSSYEQYFIPLLLPIIQTGIFKNLFF